MMPSSFQDLGKSSIFLTSTPVTGIQDAYETWSLSWQIENKNGIFNFFEVFDSRIGNSVRCVKDH